MTTRIRKALIASILTGMLVASVVTPAIAFNHRPAPTTANDPVASATDLYVFRSPDRPDTVTIVATFLPFEIPASGPNFYNFSSNVLYQIKIFNNSNAKSTPITYQFRFTTNVRDNTTYRYNKGNGVIDSITSENYNIRQTYSVTRVDQNGNSNQLASTLLVPPVNIGPKSTPNYPTIANQGVSTVDTDIKIFAGQRDDPSFADLGTLYDTMNVIVPPLPGTDTMAGLNVQAIAIQIPITRLVNFPSGKIPNNPTDPNAVIGAYASASRQQGSTNNSELRGEPSKNEKSGPAKKPSGAPGDSGARQVFGSPKGGGGGTSTNWIQETRVGMPFVDAIIIPLSNKNKWQGSNPLNDNQFLTFYQNPEPAEMEKTFIDSIRVPATPRNDMQLIFLQGFSLSEKGINLTTNGGPSNADLIRLNTAVLPKTSADPGFNRIGVFGGDLSGFPNGRRLEDDVVDAEMRIFAGATPFSTTLNGPPNNQLGDGVDTNDVPFLSVFPYAATPHPGNPPKP